MNTPNPLIKVLVVDDQSLIVEELCEFLESSGYRCVPCNTTREAIDAFVADPQIGLVLCDLHMPDMNGIELTQQLQKLAGKHRAFESILLTGRADKQDVIKALRISASPTTIKSRSTSMSCSRASSARKLFCVSATRAISSAT